MTAEAVQVQVVADPAVLATHRTGWDRLAETAPATSAAQTYAYAEAGWAVLGAQAEALAVIFAHRGAELVAVWPLHIARRGGARVAHHLGCGGREEYAEPLIAPGPQREAVARAIFEVACGLADVLEAYNISAHSPVDALIRAARGPLFADSMLSPVVSMAQEGDWDAWIGRKSKSFRSGLRADRRRLAATGALTFNEVGEADGPAFIDWLFAQKRQWLQAHGHTSSWIQTDGATAFFTRLVGRPGSGVLGFELRQGERRIAAGVCLRSTHFLEFYVTALDPAFMAYSPGNLLVEDLVKWSAARRLDFDFRLTREPYKLRWADADRPVTSYWLACTGRGRRVVRRARFRALVGRLKMQVRRVLPRRKR